MMHCDIKIVVVQNLSVEMQVVVYQSIKSIDLGHNIFLSDKIYRSLFCTEHDRIIRSP